MTHRSMVYLFRRKVHLPFHVKTNDVLDVALQMVQVYWQFVLFSSHWVKSVVTVSELDDLFPVTGSDCVVVHHADVLDQFY